MNDNETRIIKLSSTLNAWGDESFRHTLKTELQNLPADILPLNMATTQGGLVDASDISVSLISSEEKDDSLKIKVGIFFNEIIGGCNCDDDPVAANTYCEMQVLINKHTAVSEFKLLVANDH